MVYENKIIYGPVDSRRLGKWKDENLLECGRSLGINLSKLKMCSFDCIYCSCGKTQKVLNKSTEDDYFSLQEIESEVKKGFEYHKKNNTDIDYISFVGWTEPTLHPRIDKVVDLVFEIKQEYFPNTPMAIFTNSTTLYRSEVKNALKKFDRTFFKLDAISEETFQIINHPAKGIRLEEIVENLAQFSKETDKVELSAMILNANYPDICSKDYVDAIEKIKPKNNLIYLCTPDWLRPTKSGGVCLIPEKEVLKDVKNFLTSSGYKAIILPPKRKGFHPLIKK